MNGTDFDNTSSNHTDLAPDDTLQGDLAGADFATDPAFDPLGSSSTGKKLSGGFSLIVVVLAIAIVGLYSMRRLAQVTASQDTQVELTKKVNDWLAEHQTDSDPEGVPVRRSKEDTSVLGVLSQSYEEILIPLQDVKKNPFVLLESGSHNPPPTPENPTETPEERLERLRTARTGEFEAASANLAVSSIMTGSNPIARINGELLGIGGSVEALPGIAFAVKSINADQVELIAHDVELKVSYSVTLYVNR